MNSWNFPLVFCVKILKFENQIKSPLEGSFISYLHHLSSNMLRWHEVTLYKDPMFKYCYFQCRVFSSSSSLFCQFNQSADSTFITHKWLAVKPLNHNDKPADRRLSFCLSVDSIGKKKRRWRKLLNTFLPALSPSR